MPKKLYTGTVVSDKMDKTVVVAVTRTFQHPLYKKTVKKVMKFKAHDEENRCSIRALYRGCRDCIGSGGRPRHRQ